MQLLLRRSQRAGVLTGSMIFCIDARVEFSAPEKEDVRRYRLGNEVIYNSEASKRVLDKGVAAQDGTMRGSLKGLAYAALAAMKLNITIDGLERGQHVECKNLEELLGAEAAILDACTNLRRYLDTAATFDGREVLVDFTTEEPEVVAQAASVAPLLLAPTAAPFMAANAADVTAPPLHIAAPAPPLPPDPVRYELVEGEAVPVTRSFAERAAKKKSDEETVQVGIAITAGFVAVALLIAVLKLI